MNASRRGPGLVHRRRHTALLLVGVLVATLLTATATASARAGASPTGSDEPPVVSTENGEVVGLVTASMRSFLGIPYASPPVGALRWRPPQPAAPWSEPLDATALRNHCPQNVSAFGIATETEDCLHLNVHTPDQDHDDGSARLPVMVWIHGGALAVGESDGFVPTDLVTGGDVIVVTINYRLGALGFLAHPALTAESGYGGSGNYGLMDQQLALRWVQRNIAGFGGDPANVTIFGESAGGLSVASQLVSPSTTGLFHRAIVQSGAYALTQLPLAVAETLGSDYAAASGCPEQTAECLRALPVSAVLARQGTGYVPNLDGSVLPQSIGSALAAGQFHRVPVIQGTTRDEWRLQVALFHDLLAGPVTAEGYPEAIAGTLAIFGIPAAIVPQVVAEYPLGDYPSPALALGAVGTDVVFACPARTSSGVLSRYVPTFAYEFADPDAPQIFLPPASFPWGAYHASEVPYLFDMPARVPAPARTAVQEALSREMVGYWTAFARSGDPNGHPGPVWPGYDEATEAVQTLAPGAIGPDADFAEDHHCAFWASLGL